MLKSTTENSSKTWENVLKQEKEQSYFKQALKFVKQERAAGKIIYPAQSDIFNAFKFTPFEEVKAVIIGQDPYHNSHQAHGLCFSVQPDVPKPPSVKNIFKELHDDIGFIIPKDGYLEKWARQGILMLNSLLTVEAGKPLSHAHLGWDKFTDKVIQVINDYKSGVIFLLWGAPAQKKAAIVDSKKHHILKAAHPSPFSADRGFFGCKHFSKTNQLLRKMGKKEIDWQLP